jgi:hypothetical protein
LRRLFQTLDLPRRITPSKFVHDRAMPLIARQCDPLRLAAATMDWSRIHKVSAAYTHLTHGELLETLALRAELNRWGELSPSRVPDGGYLSKVTPSLEAVTALAATLLNDLRASYPGNNAGLDRLLAHHDAFIHYTAFMLSIGLLLRGQETTLLPASVLLLVMLPDFNDKALPYARAPLPEVCFGAAIRLQFRYLRAHYLAVADRLEQLARRGDTAQAEVARQLRRLAEGAPDLPLLVTIENGRLRAFSHLDLVRFLGEAWAGKADAIRHASSNVLRAEGFVYASREAAMRHIGGAQPITSSTSVWSRNDWYAESDRMQQALFSAIRLAPHGGLIRSLGRTA